MSKNLSIVTKTDLIELKELCEKVIINKTPELLPPTEGFFFGSKNSRRLLLF